MIDVLLQLEKVSALIVQLNSSIGSKLQDELGSDNVMHEINLLIDAVVGIHNALQPLLIEVPDPLLREMLDDLANHLVSIVTQFEEHGESGIRTIYAGSFANVFAQTVELLDRYIQQCLMRKRVAVYGFNQMSVQLGRLLESKKAMIVAYVTDHPEFQGKHFQQVPILPPNQAELISADYAVVTEDLSYTPPSGEVVNLADFIVKHYDFELYRAMSYISGGDERIDAFVTGLSYAEVAIDVRELSSKTINLAVSSQDLYYDFHIAKHLLSHDAVRDNVKKALIGLSYYSFEYDLSQSRLKHKTYQYYPFFRTLHHHEDLDGVIERLHRFEALAANLFTEDYKMGIYQILKTVSEQWWDSYVSDQMGPKQIGEAEGIVTKDCAKNYPETVKENIQILQEYVELLLSHDIKPIFVICPTSRHYHSLFSSRIKGVFQEIVAHFVEQFSVEVLDYFDCEHFEDVDFYDVSHLNKQGATKFTRLLQEAMSVGPMT